MEASAAAVAGGEQFTHFIYDFFSGGVVTVVSSLCGVLVNSP